MPGNYSGILIGIKYLYAAKVDTLVIYVNSGLGNGVVAAEIVEPHAGIGKHY